MKLPFSLPHIEMSKLAAVSLKYLAMLLGIALILGSAWYGGVRHERAEHLAEAAKVYERELVVAEKEKALLTQEASEAGRRMEALLAQLAFVGGNLNDAIQAAGDNPACDLTLDEFRLFNELGKEKGAPLRAPSFLRLRSSR
jgi:hypothetical protein